MGDAAGRGPSFDGGGTSRVSVRAADTMSSSDDVTWELLDAMPDAVVVVGDDGRVVRVNAQAEQLFGWSRDELEEVTLRDLHDEVTERTRPAAPWRTAERELALAAERERIATFLHDRAIKKVFVTGMALQGARSLVEQPQVRERLEQAIADLDGLVRDLRDVAFDLVEARHAEAGRT